MLPRVRTSSTSPTSPTSRTAQARSFARSSLALVALGLAGCSSSSASAGPTDAATDSTSVPDTLGSDASLDSGDSGAPPPDSSATDGGKDVSTTDAADAAAGGPPAGWLYTKGAKIYVSNGAGGGTPWMGRGVNVDDLFFCGYNNSLWMTDGESVLTTMIGTLITSWKPNFLRLSLSMASNTTTVSWLSSPAQYKTPMTNVVASIGAHAGVYVLVSLRSDASMILQDMVDGDPEATGIPSDATSTPDKTKFPTGTDATYVALVDSFATSKFVMFGVTNEAGGNKQSDATIAKAMSHAVSVIRAEEDRLGVPHHLVLVQGNDWTSSIGFYATSPLPFDDVVYEVHGYPPTAAMYTYANLPVVIGEYGTLASSTAFFADVESKQIPNLAWDFDSYNDCTPDLLQVNHSATNLLTTTWGNTVKSYLLAHAM